MSPDDNSKREQIAALLNAHNRLNNLVSPHAIPLHEYLLDLHGETVVGCIQVRGLAWYLSELGHLCVHPDYRRRGIGSKLFSMACSVAKKSGTPVLISTIREDNAASIALCEKAGWIRARIFRSRLSGENLHTYINKE